MWGPWGIFPEKEPPKSICIIAPDFMHIIRKACFWTKLWNHHLSNFGLAFIMEILRRVQRTENYTPDPQVPVAQVLSARHPSCSTLSCSLCTACPRHHAIPCIHSHLVFLLHYKKVIRKFWSFFLQFGGMDKILVVTDVSLTLFSSSPFWHFCYSSWCHEMIRWTVLSMALGDCELHVRAAYLRRLGELSTAFRQGSEFSPGWSRCSSCINQGAWIVDWPQRFQLCDFTDDFDSTC